MAKKEAPETYTISLLTTNSVGVSNTQHTIKPLPYSNVNNITWVVNYDELFHGRQELFEFCRVRFQLISFANLTHNNAYGIISTNLPSSFQNETGNGTYLGAIFNDRNPLSTTTGAYFQNGFNDIGVDINHKQLSGVQPLNIQLRRANGAFITGLTGLNYVLELYFELYNV
jgi:hypothetical protein